MRAPLKTPELRLIAFGSSSGPTIRKVSDWREGDRDANSELTALIGALVSAHVSRATMGTTAIGTAGFALCELLIAPLRSTPLIALLLFIGGICFTTWSSNSNSLIQLAAPDYMRGRLIGLYFFAFAGTGTAGGILSGWLAAAGGTELAFAVAGVAGLSVSFYVWLRGRTVPIVEQQPAPS